MTVKEDSEKVGLKLNNVRNLICRKVDYSKQYSVIHLKVAKGVYCEFFHEEKNCYKCDVMDIVTKNHVTRKYHKHFVKYKK